MKKLLVFILPLLLAMSVRGQDAAKTSIEQQINDSVRVNGVRAITAQTINNVMHAINLLNMDTIQVVNAINAQIGRSIPNLVGGAVPFSQLPSFLDTLYISTDTLYFSIHHTPFFQILPTGGGGGGGGSDSGFQVLIQRASVNVPIQKVIDGSGHRFIVGDTSATNPAAIVTQSSRQKLSDSLQGIVTAGLALKKNIADSGANAPTNYTTQASRQKLSDSLQGLITAGLALKKNLSDSSANSPGAYTTQASRQKLSDSLQALIALKKNLNDSAATNPSGYVTQASRKKLEDSLNGQIANLVITLADSTATLRALLDTTQVLRLGQPGDTPVSASGGNIYIAAQRDSLGIHHVINPDGSWTWYATTSGGSSPPFADNAALIQNNADNTKKAEFVLSNQTTGTTIADSLPTVNTMLAGLQSNNVFRGLNTFQQALVPLLDGNIDIGGGSGQHFRTVYAANLHANGPVTMVAGAGNPASLYVNSSLGLSVLPSLQVQLPPYTSPTAFPGTPVAALYTDASGNVITGAPGGGGTTVVDRTWLAPVLQEYVYGQGLISSNNVTNYAATSLDSVPFPFTTAGTGTEYGGWMVASSSGDSILTEAPIAVGIGNSIMAGHTTKSGRLEVSSAFYSTYADQPGQITYFLDSLTNYHWYNQGIGGQTMAQIRARFWRDFVGIFSNPNDARPGQTLTHKPIWGVLEGGINDIELGRTDTAIMMDFEYCASVASQNGIPLTILTIVGDGSTSLTVAGMRQVMRLNTWLLSGYLQKKYGCNVVDIFGLWAGGQNFSNRFLKNSNSPKFPSSLVSTIDEIHFLPLGYDSVALAIYNAGLPKLTKIILSSPVASVSPISNYNRINSVRISNTAAYVSAGNPFDYATSYSGITTTGSDTFAVTQPLGDSVWFSVLGTTNISGTATNTILGGVQFYIDNNPTNAINITQPRPFGGGANQELGNTRWIARDYSNGEPLWDAYLYDGVSHAFELNASAGGASINVNRGSASATLSGGVNVYGATWGVATTGGIQATGQGQGNEGSQIGLIDVGGSSTITATTNYGLGVVPGKGLALQQSNISLGAVESLMRLENLSEPTINVNNVFSSGLRIIESTATNVALNTTYQSVYISPSDSDFSATGTGKVWGALAVVPRIIGAVNTNAYAIKGDSANNWLNPSGVGDVLIGTKTDVPSSKLTIVSTTQGAIPAPIMTESQFAAISSPASGLHAILSDSGNRMAVYTGSKIVTYATTDMLGGSAAASPIIFTSSVAGTAVTNTTSGASLVGAGFSGQSSTVSSANLTAGKNIHTHGFFQYSTGSSNTNFTMTTGGAVTGFIVTLPISQTNAICEYHLYITILTTGASGTVSYQGILTFPGTSNQPIIINSSGTTSTTVNTTTGLDFQPLCAWSTASASNSIQSLPGFTITVQ